MFATSALAAALSMVPLVGAPALASSEGGPGEFLNPGPPSRNGDCVKDDGVNLNEVLGVTARIVRTFDGCYEVLAGESYVPLSNWYTDVSYANAPSTYPLAAATPMEDFLAKLVAIRYVIDPGSRQERTYRFAAGDVVKLRTLDQLYTDEPALPVALFVAELPPLRPDRDGHSFQVFVEMSAGHCDGLGRPPGTAFPKVRASSPPARSASPRPRSNSSSRQFAARTADGRRDRFLELLAQTIDTDPLNQYLAAMRLARHNPTVRRRSAGAPVVPRKETSHAPSTAPTCRGRPRCARDVRSTHDQRHGQLRPAGAYADWAGSTCTSCRPSHF